MYKEGDGDGETYFPIVFREKKMIAQFPHRQTMRRIAFHLSEPQRSFSKVAANGSSYQLIRYN